MQVPKVVEEMKVLSDRVLLKRLGGEDETGGGIAIPETSVERRSDRAVVVKAGPGLREEGDLIPTTVEEGDEVILPKYAGTELDIGGGTYIIVREPDIVARVLEEA
jgi:chaperonin GroES